MLWQQAFKDVLSLALCPTVISFCCFKPCQKRHVSLCYHRRGLFWCPAPSSGRWMPGRWRRPLLSLGSESEGCSAESASAAGEKHNTAVGELSCAHAETPGTHCIIMRQFFNSLFRVRFYSWHQSTTKFIMWHFSTYSRTRSHCLLLVTGPLAKALGNRSESFQSVFFALFLILLVPSILPYIIWYCD